MTPTDLQKRRSYFAPLSGQRRLVGRFIVALAEGLLVHHAQDAEARAGYLSVRTKMTPRMG
jgi:hypothetical protein